jgi:uncharacterized repeat protein (TIGR02543 family)
MKTQKSTAFASIFTVLAVLGLLFASCEQPTNEPPKVAVTGVTLNKTALTLPEGDKETLTPTVSPSGATNKNVSWTSSDLAIAEVDANGKVTAKTVGTAEITVTTEDGGKTAECTVTVMPAPDSIAVTGQPTKTKYAVGETLDLTGLEVTATYSDTTTGTVTITAEQHITGFNPNTVGEQTLTITYGGKTTTFKVTVIAVSKIEITKQPTNTRFPVGEQLDITGLEVTATYSDNSTETVTITTGHITGFDPDTEGEQTLTVTYGGKTATFTVTVFLYATPGLQFTLINNGTAYEVSRGTASAARIVIPPVYNNLPVTTIAEWGFYGYTDMTGITIPDSVTNIDRWAFENCSGLTSVIIPASVTSIDFQAFDYCSGLTTVFYSGADNAAWSGITIGNSNAPLTNATRYYYSATQPTEDGNFWYFEDGVPAVWGAAVRQLAMPSGLQVNNTTKILAWNTVTNAISYLVDIDGTEYTANTNSYSLSALTAFGTYTVKVKAIGNGTEFTDSSWSGSVQYTISKPVSKIEITGQPAKTRYAIGEPLDLTGLEVTATYSDNSTETVTITAADISGFDSSTAGTQTLTISYGGQTDTFTVTVVAVVTFNPNNGNWDGSTANKTEEVAGTTVTKPDNPARIGYTFGEWYKEAALTNQWNFATNTVTTNTTLYAKWNPITYTVQYDKNDATASGTTANSSHTYDVERALTANGYTRTNYVFNGWNTQADGSGMNYADRQTVKNLTVTAGDVVTLYAKWVTQDELDFGSGAVINTFNVSNTTEWNSAVTSITGGGNNMNYIINVTADFNISSTFGSVTGIKVSIRGVGRTLTLSSNGRILAVNNSQTVILRDVTLRGRSSNNTYLVYVGGTFTMNSGKITGNENTFRGYYSDGVGYASNGAGVYVENGTFNMNGGEISNNHNTSSDSGSSVGGGVYITGANGTFIMNGGEIVNNSVSREVNITGLGNSVYAYGGGVYVNGGTFTMNSGTIRNNLATASTSNNYSSSNVANAYGGGVYVNTGTFTMNNGAIYGNTANGTTSGIGGVNTYGRGGGVYMERGAFNMKGGTIYGNTSASGGGVNRADGTLRISDGIIYGSNEANASLRNSAALWSGTYGTAQYGTFNGNTWNSNGNLSTTNNTIRVVNGVLQ